MDLPWDCRSAATRGLSRDCWTAAAIMRALWRDCGKVPLTELSRDFGTVEMRGLSTVLLTVCWTAMKTVVARDVPTVAHSAKGMALMMADASEPSLVAMMATRS